jgi:hypothetical protein
MEKYRLATLFGDFQSEIVYYDLVVRHFSSCEQIPQAFRNHYSQQKARA